MLDDEDPRPFALTKTTLGSQDARSSHALVGNGVRDFKAVRQIAHSPSSGHILLVDPYSFNACDEGQESGRKFPLRAATFQVLSSISDWKCRAAFNVVIGTSL